MKSFFTSKQAKQDIEKLYQSKLDELNINYEFQNLETSFGKTNIVVTGSDGKPPLVLIHGSNGCAPVAIEAMIGLIDHFKIYAIDVIGQPNLSAETRPSMSDDSYGKWVYEILSRLHIQNVTLVGISFGGFIAWKTLVHEDKRVKQAFLIVPAGIVNGNPITAIRKVFFPMKMYKWTKKIKYVHAFLSELFTERDEFALRFLSHVFLHFKMDFSPIPSIKNEEANQIDTSVHIIGAEKDLFFPGDKMIKRAHKIFPIIKKTLVLRGSKHVPDESGNKQIVKLILEESANLGVK